MTLFSLKGVKFKDIISYPNIEIEQGKTTFICGKSGCGKSTMLKLLNGVEAFDSGSLQYCGKEITEYDSIELRREVLLFGQSVYLFDGDIRENFKQFYAYRDLPSPDDNVIKDYLAVCSANFKLSTNCATMSGGERQRVFISICLSFAPKVLLLDEPTSALDENTSTELFENILRYCSKRDITVIAISHNTSLVRQFADAIINLED